MKKLGLICLVFVVAFLSACNSTERQAYDKNLAVWKAQAIQHYRFELKIGCLCPWSALMPLKVEIQNGGIVSMVASNGGDITPYQDTFRAHATLASQFDTVDKAISSGAYKLAIQYDAKYGFPNSIIIDQYRFMTDDAIGYYVTNFEPLP